MLMLALSEIRADGGTQTRAGTNQEVVREYAEAIEAGSKLPPVTVYHDGATYWLADGFHRLSAYQSLGALEVEAEVRQGEKRDAVLHSVGANATHGLRRTNEDKRRAVQVLLEDTEWREWSDREISRRAGVGNKFVGDMRKVICVPNTDETERKVKRGGSEYTMQVPPKTDLSEYTQPRHIKTYNPPLLSDGPDELEVTRQIDQSERTSQITKLDKLEPDEPDIWAAMPAEIREAAEKPMPVVTPHSLLNEVTESPEYKLAERVGKHLSALVGLPPGHVKQAITGPHGQAFGLPGLARHLIEEMLETQREPTDDHPSTITFN